MLALALATLLAAAPEPAFVAVVDPGHGGDRDGAVAPSGAREKDLALAISKRLARRLRAEGASVLLTREVDEPLELSRRVVLANEAAADLFVSIHLNAMPRGARTRRGVETYFLSADATDARSSAVAARENADRGAAGDAPRGAVAGILADLGHVENLAESSRLAHAIHERLVRATGARDDGVKQAPFHVLAGAQMPAVLVEVGFLTHPGEARLLASAAYQEKIAAAIADGIAAFRGERQASR